MLRNVWFEWMLAVIVQEILGMDQVRGGYERTLQKIYWTEERSVFYVVKRHNKEEKITIVWRSRELLGDELFEMCNDH